MHKAVPESQVPVCPLAIAGQSLLLQHPDEGMHLVPPGQRFMGPPQVKSQVVPLQLAVAPAGA